MSKTYLLYERDFDIDRITPLLREKTGLSPIKQEFKKHRSDFEDGSLLVVLAKDSSLAPWLYRMRFARVSILLLPNHANPLAQSTYQIPSTIEETLDLLIDKPKISQHIVAIQEEALLGKAVIGDESWLESSSALHIWWSLLKNITSLRLFPVTVQTKTKTFQTATFVIEAAEEALMHKLREPFFSDTPNLCQRATTIFYAPQSIVEAVKLRLFFAFRKKRGLPKGIGTIKAQTISLSSPQEFAIAYNGSHHTTDSLHIRRLSTSYELYTGWQGCASEEPKESIRIEHIPTDPEMIDFYTKITLPLLPIASESAFAQMFQKIRQNAKLSSTYLFLLFISVLMAAIGLFQDSAPTIIGAMILAPLMGPLLSFAMGTIRFDLSIIKPSLFTILFSTLLGLAISALLTQWIPLHHMTQQMALRTHPTLLDLGVAILAGLAAGYGYANPKVGESLAGVAIAVALIPPLCVAGIGLGWSDLSIFSNAMLLYLTNITGILFAAGTMFYLLGFASKRYVSAALAIKLLMVAIIALPLYIATAAEIEKERLYESLEAIAAVHVEKIVETRSQRVVYIDVIASQKEETLKKLQELKKRFPNIRFVISYKETL